MMCQKYVVCPQRRAKGAVQVLPLASRSNRVMCSCTVRVARIGKIVEALRLYVGQIDLQNRVVRALLVILRRRGTWIGQVEEKLAGERQYLLGQEGVLLEPLTVVCFPLRRPQLFPSSGASAKSSWRTL